MVVCNPLLQADCEGPYPHLLRRLLRHTDIGSPDLVRPVDGQPFEQIGIDRMLLSWNAGSGFGSYADNPQRPHHGCRFFPANRDALAPKPGRITARTVLRCFEILLVHLP